MILGVKQKKKLPFSAIHHSPAAELLTVDTHIILLILFHNADIPDHLETAIRILIFDHPGQGSPRGSKPTIHGDLLSAYHPSSFLRKFCP